MHTVERWPHPETFPYPVEWHPLFKDKLFLALSPELNAFVVQNLSAFGRAFGLDGVLLSQVAGERLEQHRGWRCRKLDASLYPLARTVEWRQLGPNEPLPLQVSNWLLGITTLNAAVSRACSRGGDD
ncbi:hypothetical protein GCM10011504_49030 [Siccirubricoccus deserti]|nr:hypothetical protein GCM10011504_49030 [Siccirubricoccus deserti]